VYLPNLKINFAAVDAAASAFAADVLPNAKMLHGPNLPQRLHLLLLPCVLHLFRFIFYFFEF